MGWLGALRKKDIYMKLFISYVFILLIPMAFTWMLYAYTARRLTDNAEKRNLNMLEQTREIMDGHIGEAEILLNQIANNKKVLQLMYSDNRSREEILITYRNLISELSSVSYSGEFIAGYYIWFRKEGYVVSPDGRFQLEEYYDFYHKGGGQDYEEWAEKLEDGQPYLGYFCSYPIKLEGVWKEVMDFSLSFPVGTRRGNLGSIHMQLQQDRVRQLLSRILDDGKGYVCVVAGEDEIVTSLGGTIADFPVLSILPKEQHSGYFTAQIEGREEMVSFTRSSKNDWIYVAVQPLEHILKEARGLRNLFFLLLLLCLAAGGGLAAGMVYWTTFPIRKLLLSLRRYQEGAGSGSWNDFENTIAKLINENTYIRYEVEQHRPIVRSTFLTKLIRGKFSVRDEIESNMQELSIVISGVRYTVLLIYISGYGRLVSRNILAELEAAKAVLRKFASVSGVLEDALDVDTDETIQAYIVPFRDDGEERCITELREAIGILREMADNSGMNLNLAFFWGNLVDSIFRIDLSYTQAKHKLEHYIMEGEVGDSMSAEVPEMEDGRYVYPMETEFKLIHLCKEGKIQEICELLDLIKAGNFIGRHLEYSSMALLMDEMKGTVYKLCGIIPMDREVQKKLGCRLKALDSCDFDAVKMMYSLLCSQVNEKRRCQEGRLAQSIAQYMDEHYTEAEFYLVSLAEHFNLNESYLSLFIKEKLGENFTVYLQRLRLKRSCQLLKETEETIDAISVMSGYSSSHVFRRAFKRQYGITPLTYRESVGSGVGE